MAHHAGGMVVSAVSGEDDDAQLRIMEDEHEKFEEFMMTVPTPTWWERGKDTRVKIVAGSILGALFLIVVSAATFVVSIFDK